MKVINLFGGPGTGKSTQAAMVFAKFKMAGYNSELVTEYAKEATWEDRKNILTEDQLYVFAKQNRKLVRIKNKVDIVVVDSPLLAGLCYVPRVYFSTFEALVKEVWDSYDNTNYFLKRSVGYQPNGRNQTEIEARRIDNSMIGLLHKYNVPYKELNILEDNISEIIFQDILKNGDK